MHRPPTRPRPKEIKKIPKKKESPDKDNRARQEGWVHCQFSIVFQSAHSTARGDARGKPEDVNGTYMVHLAGNEARRGGEAMQFKVCGDRLRDSFYSRRPGAFFFRFNDVLSEGPAPFTRLNRQWEGVITAASTFSLAKRSRMTESKTKKDKQTFSIDRVTATAPACAHAAACITPDTKVRLTFIPSSRCKAAAASMPASVAGICQLLLSIFFFSVCFPIRCHTVSQSGTHAHERVTRGKSEASSPRP